MLSPAAMERAYDIVQRIDSLLRRLRLRAAAPPAAAASPRVPPSSPPPRREPFRPAQARVLLRAGLMGLYQRVGELLDATGEAGPGATSAAAAVAAAAALLWIGGSESAARAAATTAATAEEEAECGADAALVTECRQAAAALAAIYDGAAALAPAEALRTLAATRRQLAGAALRQEGLGADGGRAAMDSDALEVRARALFAKFDPSGAGRLGPAEIAAAMAALGIAVTGASATAISLLSESSGPDAVI